MPEFLTQDTLPRRAIRAHLTQVHRSLGKQGCRAQGSTQCLPQIPPPNAIDFSTKAKMFINKGVGAAASTAGTSRLVACNPFCRRGASRPSQHRMTGGYNFQGEAREYKVFTKPSSPASQPSFDQHWYHEKCLCSLLNKDSEFKDEVSEETKSARLH